MITSRVVLTVDNGVVPGPADYNKGNCTDIQMGALKNRARGGCVPMLCGQNISVQCLSMPYFSCGGIVGETPTGTLARKPVGKGRPPNDDRRALGSSARGVARVLPLIQSMFVKCMVKTLSMKHGSFQNINVNAISMGDLCHWIDTYAKEYMNGGGGSWGGGGGPQKTYLRDTCAPRLLHLYPGPVVHPDVDNINLQLWFSRTTKNYKRTVQRRKKLRKKNATRRKEKMLKKKEDHSMSMHAIMLKNKIDAIKLEMKQEDDNDRKEYQKSNYSMLNSGYSPEKRSSRRRRRRRRKEKKQDCNRSSGKMLFHASYSTKKAERTIQIYNSGSSTGQFGGGGGGLTSQSSLKSNRSSGSFSSSYDSYDDGSFTGEDD